MSYGNTVIEWSQAIQKDRDYVIHKQREDNEYQEMLELSKNEVYEEMGIGFMSYDNFLDICTGNGVEIDDVINSMI
jgi:hypothetical protein